MPTSVSAYVVLALSHVVVQFPPALDPAARKPGTPFNLEALAGTDRGWTMTRRSSLLAAPRTLQPPPADQPWASTITRATHRNEKGQIRFFRYGSVVTNWEVKT